MNAISDIAPPDTGELRTSGNLDELVKALVRAVPNFKPIAKDSNVKIEGKYNFRFASLGEILEATRPALLAEGLICLQMVAQSGARTLLVTRLIHTSGQWLEAAAPVTIVGNTPQAVGSGITYQRRYSYSAMLGIVADEDDDGQKAATPPAKPKAAPAQQRQREAPGSDVAQQAGAINSAGMGWPILSRDGSATPCRDRTHWIATWKFQLGKLRDGKTDPPEAKLKTLRAKWEVNSDVFRDLTDRGDEAAVQEVRTTMKDLAAQLEGLVAADFPGDRP